MKLLIPSLVLISFLGLNVLAQDGAAPSGGDQMSNENTARDPAKAKKKNKKKKHGKKHQSKAT